MNIDSEPLQTAKRLNLDLMRLRNEADVEKVKTELRLREREAYGPLNNPAGLRLDVWTAIEDLKQEYERDGNNKRALWDVAINAAAEWMQSLT